MVKLVRLALLALSLPIVSCGGATPPPRAQDQPDVDEGDRHDGPALDVSAEIGALNEDQVTRVFQKSVRQLETCLRSGAERVEFLGGSVAFYIKVDESGGLAHAHVEQSSLGDRQTEKCMLDALRGQAWPAPVGGKVGLARKSFDFDPPNDVRPPVDWDPEQVSETLSKTSSEIQRCKGSGGGSFGVTMYVATSGRVLSVGVTPPDEQGESAVDCLVEVLKGQNYPKPGSWPAKVSFSL